MRHLGPGALLACGGLALLLASPPAGAQEVTSERALIERLEQIRGQLEPGGGASIGDAVSAEELIRQLEAVARQLDPQAAGGERPALGEDEVRRLVQEGLGVEVLSAKLVERNGQPVYALTVMNPPGNYNGAFMVRTLLVDGATGGLLGQVPHAPRAAEPSLTQDARAASPESTGLEIRRRTYR